ncbi:HNH endonuclease family protein [Streptomyces sp. NBC_00272]|nr:MULTISPECIES: HNH endonuclease family protein [unclassified Streptomyces]
MAPQVAAGCKLTGGSWRSAYDDVVVTDAGRLDVDHFVPLAEVCDSEQVPWSAARREAYANDQASPVTLIAVSAASNRSKADKDPAQWLPSDGSYHCTYAATWVGTKLRWDLAADENERQALLGLVLQRFFGWLLGSYDVVVDMGWEWVRADARVWSAGLSELRDWRSCSPITP